MNGHTAPKLPATHYLDNRIFTDAEIFAEEHERIFAKAWQFVCHESEVEKAGDFRAARVAGKPILLARGEDGVLRGFYNICRHRAAEVVREASGNARSFTCFYHHWNYGLDGSLRAVAKPAGYEAVKLDKSELGLVPVRVETLAGLVFVSLDESAGPLREFFGGIVEAFEEPLGTKPLETFHFHQAIVRTNWKLWQDNNSERYHSLLHASNRTMLPWVLGQTSAMKLRIFPHGHSGYWTDKGEARVNYKRGGHDDVAQDPLPGMAEGEMRVLNLFPDLMINIRSNVVRLDRMVPLGPGETLIEWRGLGVKGDSDALRAIRVRHHNLFWGPAGRNLPEDVLAVESQWRSMQAGAVRYSILAREEGLNPTDDANVRAYYQEWGRRMGRAPASLSA
ncbi:MAG: aromatic ring-hydroxylating oxygenase subunit alpha [Betaproteobacteria bacterium]